MNKSTGIWAVIAVLSLAWACVPSDKTADSGQADAETKALRSGPVADLPPASVLIAHRVTDYDVWKRRFDDLLQARKDASCLGHYLKRGIDNSDVVYIYCLATDAEMLRVFLDSAALAEAMQGAGVQGAPEITLMKPMTRNLVPEQKLPGIIVMHLVEDYESWRETYDEFDDFRRESGIVGHAVSQRFGNPNHVVVYHQANSVSELRAFVDSWELGDLMQHAGVVSDPDIRFIQVVDFAKY